MGKGTIISFAVEWYLSRISMMAERSISSNVSSIFCLYSKVNDWFMVPFVTCI